MLVFWIWSLPILLLCGCLALVFFIEHCLLRMVLFVVCLPCHRERPDQHPHKDCANTLMFLQASILLGCLLQGAWTFASLPVVCLLRPCGASGEHLSFTASIPVRFLGLLMETLLFDGRPPDRGT